MFRGLVDWRGYDASLGYGRIWVVDGKPLFTDKMVNIRTWVLVILYFFPSLPLEYQVMNKIYFKNVYVLLYLTKKSGTPRF